MLGSLFYDFKVMAEVFMLNNKENILQDLNTLAIPEQERVKVYITFIAIKIYAKFIQY